MMRVYTKKVDKNENVTMAAPVASTSQLVDRRPEIKAQRNLQAMIQGSPRVKQLKVIKDMTTDRVFQMQSKSSHSYACGCPACTSLRSAPIVQSQSEANIVQRCEICGKSSCKKGEECRQPPSGVFGSGVGSWGTKFYNQKQGHGGKPAEWEHAVPGKAYRTAGMGKSYKSAPVLQIPKDMHRAGVKGVGGGISSTGSSHSASMWSTGMGGDLASGRFSDALWKGVIDGMNSAMATGHSLQEAAHGYWRLIMMHYQRGDIDEATAHQLIQMLMNTMYNMTDRPGLYGGGKGPDSGSGSGGAGPSGGAGASAMVTAGGS